MRQFRTLIYKLKVYYLAVLIAAGVLFTAPYVPAQDMMGPANIDTASHPGELPDFRMEKVPVPGGAELITIFARSGTATSAIGPELPLVTVLRDTLGDDRPENDQLRYLWMLSYTKPSTKQRLASVVPLLYTRVGNKNDPGSGPPPPVVDMRKGDGPVWNSVLWTVC